MRILIILLLFVSGVQGQIINASAPYRQTKLLLDDYAATAAFSLRKIKTSYTGNCVRVRKDTTGQPEQDIAFDGSGVIDTVSLKSFVGGNSGYVVTWYNQEGSGDAKQSTASRQPRIVNAGVVERENNKVCLRWTNNTERLVADFPFNYVHPNTFFCVSKLSASTGISASVLFDSYGNFQHVFYSTGNTATPNDKWSFAAGTTINGGTTDANIKLTTVLFNTTNSQFWINGVSNATGNTGTSALVDLSIGNIRGYPNPIATGYEWSGAIFELVFYGQVNQSSNRTAIESNINSYYAIY